jgi:YbbR domain-containing protein
MLKLKEKIKEAFTKNIGLKILAAVLSIILWVTIVNLNDPVTTASFRISVNVTNENVLKDKGEYYTVEDGNPVQFHVQAKRSILEKLTASDFSATADLSLMDSSGRVPVTITAMRYTNKVTISQTQHYLKLKIGKNASNRFIIDAKTTGTPEKGYVLDSVKVSPNAISVSGPEDKVSKIASVTATCNIDGISADMTEAVVPKFYDKNGVQINTTGLTFSKDSVNISVTIRMSKSVRINVQSQGKLPDGMELAGITTDPTTVSIMGLPEKLNEISEITIPSSVVDLSAINGDWSTTVDLTSYLPEGVELTDDSSSQVKINVSVSGKNSSTMTVPSSNISILNVPAGMSAAFETDSISVVLSGTESTVASLNAGSITGTVNASGLSAGSHVLPVTFSNLPEGVSASSVTVKVTITEKARTTN